MVDWQKEIEQAIAEADVCDMLGFLNPWVGQIIDPSPQAVDALQTIFQNVLEKHGTHEAIWFAFCTGQAFEKAMEG